MTEPTTPTAARVPRQACTVLLSHEERKRLRIAAAALDQPMSTYIRESALARAIRDNATTEAA